MPDNKQRLHDTVDDMIKVTEKKEVIFEPFLFNSP